VSANTTGKTAALPSPAMNCRRRIRDLPLIGGAYRGAGCKGTGSPSVLLSQPGLVGDSSLSGFGGLTNGAQRRGAGSPACRTQGLAGEAVGRIGPDSTPRRTAPPHTRGPGGVIRPNAIVIDVELVDVKG
jgi:hypothetical protein